MGCWFVTGTCMPLVRDADEEAQDLTGASKKMAFEGLFLDKR